MEELTTKITKITKILWGKNHSYQPSPLLATQSAADDRPEPSSEHYISTRTACGDAGWKGFIGKYYLILLTGLALAVFLLMAGARAVYAQAPTPSDDDVNAVARELYCPVCENIPLDVCPTTACAQWRELIREMLAQGKSKQDIKQYFVAQYGDRVLSEPPRSGLNWLAYGLPPVVILLGAYLVYRGLRGVIARRPRPAAAAPANPPPADGADPYLARVEEELRKRE